jgi:hypothetical protein
MREVENFESHEQLRKALIDNNKQNIEKLASVSRDFNENTASICIQNVQKEWQQYNNQFLVMCKFLYEIVKHFPADHDPNSLFSSSTKNFIDFYAKICNFACTKNKPKRFCDTEQFSDFRRLLQLSSLNTTNEIAITFLKLIETKILNEQANFQPDFLNDIHEFCEILTKIRINYTVNNANNSLNEEDIEAALNEDFVAPSKPARKNSDDMPMITEELVAKKRLGTQTLGRRSSIRTLKPIQENSPPKRRTTMCIPQLNTLPSSKTSKKSQSTKVIETAKLEMFDWLSHQFSIYFDSDYTANFPHSAFFCYSKLDHMKKRLFDVQRINMHECLMNSYAYFKSNDYLPQEEFSPKRNKNLRRSPNSGRIIPEETKEEKMLPLNTIYKLYLECGHMVNLYDWLQVILIYFMHLFVFLNKIFSDQYS